jgi:hypothetical protein
MTMFLMQKCNWMIHLVVQWRALPMQECPTCGVRGRHLEIKKEECEICRAEGAL